MVPLEYELYAIIYHQRATEALYLLKMIGLPVYMVLLCQKSRSVNLTLNMILSFFSLGSCPSKKCEKVAYMHTVALTDSASRNLFLKSFENFKGLF